MAPPFAGLRYVAQPDNRMLHPCRWLGLAMENGPSLHKYTSQLIIVTVNLIRKQMSSRF